MIIEIIFVITLFLLIIINLIFRMAVKVCKNNINETKLSGFEIARKVSSLLSQEEIHIIKKNGNYLDHFNKERNVIKLSPQVFDGVDNYAAITAINVALETAPKRKNTFYKRKINSFIIIASYITIIFGAIANNNTIIHFGMILFALAFVVELIILANIFGTKEDLNKLYNDIKKQNLIKPVNEYQNNCMLIALVNLATLPYNFIKYFR